MNPDGSTTRNNTNSPQYSIEKSCSKYLNEYVRPNGVLVLGLSGGVDSVSLLHLVRKLRPDIDLHAVHVNHGLRETSKDDESFCADVCSLYGVRLHCFQENIRQASRTSKQSLETAGRHARQSAYKRVMEYVSADYLVTGHHANDRAETFFFNLLRGSGLQGLSAMGEVNPEACILRPLISTKKSEIYHFAQACGLSWKEDETNSQSDFTRNWFRNDVFPVLSERYHRLIETVVTTASRLDKVNDFVVSQAWDFIRSNSLVYSDDRDIDRSTFFSMERYLNQHEVLRHEIVHQIWKMVHGSTQHFSAKRAEEFDRWVENNNGNGSTLYFGEDIRFCNRNGRVGLKFKSNTTEKNRFWPLIKGNSDLYVDSNTLN